MNVCNDIWISTDGEAPWRRGLAVSHAEVALVAERTPKYRAVGPAMPSREERPDFHLARVIDRYSRSAQ